MQNIEIGSTAENVFGTEVFCGSVSIAIRAKSKKKGKDNLPARFLTSNAIFFLCSLKNPASFSRYVKYAYPAECNTQFSGG